MTTRHYQSPSRLGRCNIDDLLTTEALEVRRHLEIYLHAAEKKMRNGLSLPTGDMWTRAWELVKEYRDQIAALDEVMS